MYSNNANLRPRNEPYTRTRTDHMVLHLHADCRKCSRRVRLSRCFLPSSRSFFLLNPPPRNTHPKRFSTTMPGPSSCSSYSPGPSSFPSWTVPTDGAVPFTVPFTQCTYIGDGSPSNMHSVLFISNLTVCPNNGLTMGPSWGATGTTFFSSSLLFVVFVEVSEAF